MIRLGVNITEDPHAKVTKVKSPDSFDELLSMIDSSGKLPKTHRIFFLDENGDMLTVSTK